MGASLAKHSKRFYEFGPFRFDVANGLLLRDEQPVPLAPKAVELLYTLLENRGDVISRDELINRLWPDTFVEEMLQLKDNEGLAVAQSSK